MTRSHSLAWRPRECENGRQERYRRFGQEKLAAYSALRARRGKGWHLERAACLTDADLARRPQSEFWRRRGLRAPI